MKEQRLTLIKELGLQPYYKARCNSGLFKCSCGNERILPFSVVNHKKKPVLSCGCLQKDTARKIMKTHGMYRTRIFRIWMNMKSRCNNKKYDGYKYYGGKGVKICDRWNDFINFFNDNKENYRDNLTIDRIDSNGNYEPGNCRWITNSENTRRAHAEFTVLDCGTMVCKRGHKGMFQKTKKSVKCVVCHKLVTDISRYKLKMNRETQYKLNMLKLSLSF